MLFPVERLIVEKAEFESSDALLSIRIDLQAFEYFDGEKADTEETSVVLDRIDLNGSGAAALSGTTKTFPVNPEDGYIDGSIYIQSAHHPVDVHEIAFGEIAGDSLKARFSAKIVLSFEGLGDYDDTPWTFDLLIPTTVL